MEIVRIPIDQLTPDPTNAKDHPKEQVDQIIKSIDQLGNLDPIGVWGKDNLIVEGHGRYLALKKLGYKEAECIRLDSLTEEERKAYALIHNKLTMNTGFIPEALDMNLEAITEIDMSQFGFDVSMFEETPEAAEDDFDQDSAPDNIHGVQRGDVWQCGDHRVMCGDSSSAEDFTVLMGGAAGRYGIYRSALRSRHRRQKQSARQDPEKRTSQNEHRRRHDVGGGSVSAARFGNDERS